MRQWRTSFTRLSQWVPISEKRPTFCGRSSCNHPEADTEEERGGIIWREGHTVIGRGTLIHSLMICCESLIHCNDIKRQYGCCFQLSKILVFKPTNQQVLCSSLKNPCLTFLEVYTIWDFHCIFTTLNKANCLVSSQTRTTMECFFLKSRDTLRRPILIITTAQTIFALS